MRVKYKRAYRILTFLFLLIGWQDVLCNFGQANELLKSSQVVLDVPMETQSAHFIGTNGFTWKSGYDIGLENNSVVIEVAINLVPAGGLSRIELNSAKKIWQTGIERIWNKRFALETSSGTKYPIYINVKFKGPKFHHDVIVRPGAGRTDELNWNLLDSQELVSHEFGHMLGVYDEYYGGSLAASKSVIDVTSIMSANPDPKAVTYARHYELFSRWFMGQTNMENVIIVEQREVNS